MKTTPALRGFMVFASFAAVACNSILGVEEKSFEESVGSGGFAGGSAGSAGFMNSGGDAGGGMVGGNAGTASGGKAGAAGSSEAGVGGSGQAGVAGAGGGSGGFAAGSGGTMPEDAAAEGGGAGTDLEAGSAGAAEDAGAEDGQLTDPSTALLLHCDGVEGSTTLADSSQNALIVSAHGNAHVATGGRFGSKLAFDGNGDWLSIQSSDALSLGGNDFTIEFWVRLFAWPTQGQSLLVQRWATNTCSKSWDIRLGFNGAHTDSLYFLISSDGAGESAWIGPTLTLGTWHHVAMVRRGEAYTMYLNGKGTLLASSTASPATTTCSVGVGGNDYQSGYYASGDFDEIRISRIARWTSDFTPPSAPY